MALLAVVLLIARVVLTVAGLAVRFAGSKHVLLTIGAGASDVAGLNRWAGNRLLLIAGPVMALGAIGLDRPVYALAGLVVLVLLGAGVLFWLLVGAERFRNAR